jgi:hypothetical protein
MASMNGLSAYNRIVAQREMNRNFSELHEQRSASRQQAAQRVMSQGDSLRSAMANNIAQNNEGQSQLVANIIRTRAAEEAKAKAKAAASKYA